MEMEKPIQTENGGSEFQVRLLKNEGIGLLTDRSGGNYLILDSLEYWYDLIQSQTPQKQKCSCKCDWFGVLFRYDYRDDTPDIRKVQVITTCTDCGKTTMRMSIDIDYSPTEQLVAKPITFCETPNIKYKFSDLSALWTPEDLEKFLRFMMEELNLTAYYHYFKQPDNIRVFEPVSLDWAIQRGDLFLQCYFTGEPIDIEAVTTYPDEKGVMVKRDLWRKEESVEFNRIIISGAHGLAGEAGHYPMYFLKFCTQYIDRGEVRDKSKEFAELTARLMNWLKENFNTGRGKNCFDSEEE